jgi:hypothetical protein
LTWEELDPAVWRIPALSLPPAPDLGAVAGVPGLTPAGLPDDDLPPPQLFCHFPQGAALDLLPPEALPQIFLAPPRNPESLKAAHEWAQENNIAILPAEACNEELLALAGGQGRAAVWRITSPKEGDTVSGQTPIVGTASFDPNVVEFYKLELGIPQSGSEVQWLTLGDTHNTPVVNGQLETLFAEGLAPGNYFLRLIVVKDSNYVGEPHTIQIAVE